MKLHDSFKIKNIFCPVSLVMSAFFSFSLVTGIMLRPYAEKIGYIDTPRFLLYFLIGLIVFYPISLFLLNLKSANNKLSGNNSCFIVRNSEWIFGAVTFILCSVCLLSFFPGNLSYDGLYQIDSWLGHIQLSDHHPVAVSAYLGTLFSLGKRVSDNFGILLTYNM